MAMKKVRPVEGKTLTEFADAYEEAQAELSRATILYEKEVSPLQMLIYYEDPETIEDAPETDYQIQFDSKGKYITVSILVDDYEGRYCAECDNYEWGVRCPYRTGRVKPMDRACPMFNVTITRG